MKVPLNELPAEAPRGGYPGSVGSFAFSHPAMPSGITNTSA